MLDTTSDTSLQVIAAKVKLQLERVVVNAESSFYELGQVVTLMRTEFPHTRFVGPFLHPDEAQVSLELSMAQEQLEVRIVASKRMLADNEIGW